MYRVLGLHRQRKKKSDQQKKQHKTTQTQMNHSKIRPNEVRQDKETTYSEVFFQTELNFIIGLCNIQSIQEQGSETWQYKTKHIWYKIFQFQWDHTSCRQPCVTSMYIFVWGEGGGGGVGRATVSITCHYQKYKIANKTRQNKKRQRDNSGKYICI